MIDIDNLKQVFKYQMQNLYGDELDRIILFGSYARGDYNEHSDVDLMVVLKKDNLSVFREIRKIHRINSQLNIDYNNVISVMPVSLNHYLNYSSGFFENVKEEGVEV